MCGRSECLVAALLPLALSWSPGARAGACDAYAWLNGEACRERTIDGVAECACTVETAPPGGPFCTRTDRRARLAVAVEPPDGIEDGYQLVGLFPDTSSLAPQALPGLADFESTSILQLGRAPYGPRPEGDPTECTADGDCGSGERCFDGVCTASWNLEPVVSPDGTMIALVEMRATAGDDQRGVSLLRCGEGGWRVDRLFTHITAQMARWGVPGAAGQVLYVVQDGLERYVFDPEPVELDGGEEVLRLAGAAEIVARADGGLANGDMDLGFSGDGAADDFAALLVPVAADHAWGLDAVIAVTDLGSCRGEGGQQGTVAEVAPDMPAPGASTRPYNCRTLWMTRTSLAGREAGHEGRAATNPAVQDGGRLLSWHRENVLLDSVLSVAINPFVEPSLLERCDQDGDRDGFAEAIDCSGLFRTGDQSDYMTRCPDVHCCESGADCSFCVSEGFLGSDRTADGQTCGQSSCCVPDSTYTPRNLVGFFDIGDTSYLFHQQWPGGQTVLELREVQAGPEGPRFAPPEGYEPVAQTPDPWLNFAPTPLRLLPPGTAETGDTGGVSDSSPPGDSHAPDPAASAPSGDEGCGCGPSTPASGLPAVLVLLVAMASRRRGKDGA